MGEFEYSSSKTTALVHFQAHKFPYTSSVYYQCNVRLCIRHAGGCEDTVSVFFINESCAAWTINIVPELWPEPDQVKLPKPGSNYLPHESEVVGPQFRQGSYIKCQNPKQYWWHRCYMLTLFNESTYIKYSSFPLYVRTTKISNINTFFNWYKSKHWGWTLI